MASPLVFSSIVTKSHLHLARALRQTVSLHHPAVPHYVLLLDAASNDDLPEPTASEIYVPLNLVVTDLGERHRLTFRYDALELSCALKPLFARYLFDEQHADLVAYFDCDMSLHAPLPASALPSASSSVVLTPQWLSGSAPGLEAKWLMYGAYNAGYFAVRNDRRGRAFINFWWERCRKFCVNDFSEGLFLDQAWLNLAPLFFHDTLSVCSHPGMNVSWWNLHERGLHFDRDRVLTSTGEPLVLFHWSQVHLGNDERIFRQENALELVNDAQSLNAVRELHHRFALLVASDRSAAEPPRYPYGTFSDGSPILTADRRAFRHHGELISGRSANPFDESAWFKSRRIRGRLKDASLLVTGSSKPATAVASLIRAGRTWAANRRHLLRAVLKPRASRTLTDLAAIHGSDKGVVTGQRHGYTLIYERLFAEYRSRPALNILEIGLRHDPYYKRTSRISPSLAMWRDYFPTAQIFGFDINDFSEMAGGRIHIFQGDQGDPRAFADLLKSVDAFDIVIDDGSHASYHQLVTLRTLFPKLRAGGVYVVEDLGWPPAELEAVLPPTRTMTELLGDDAFLRDLGVSKESVEFASDGKLGIIKKPMASSAKAAPDRWSEALYAESVSAQR